MRDSLKDPGRLRHMLDMALMLEAEKEKYSFQAICEDKVLFYGLTKIVEIIGEAAFPFPDAPSAEFAGM